MSQISLDLDFDDGGEPTFGVRELADVINLTLKRGFRDGVWVRGEIEGLQHARAGHVYFTLVERTEEGSASIPIACFANTWTRLVRPVLSKYRLKLENGLVVRIHGNVNLYAPSGKLSVVMDGFDARFTLGQLAADRDRLLRLLLSQGLLDRNKAVPVPLVPLRVGVVTSVGSAAWHDFTNELSSSGIGFQLFACDTRVQGDGSPERIAAAIATLTAMDLDVVVVIRGGGSRTDLASFDHELVARAVASSPVPVFTGLGHEIDRSIADDVAHSAFKTPTAVAAHLVERVRSHQASLDVAAARVAHLAGQHLVRAERSLRDQARSAGERTRRTLASADSQLVRRGAEVAQQSRNHLRSAATHLAVTGGRLRSAGNGHLSGSSMRMTDRSARLVRAAPRAANEATRALDALNARVILLDPVRTLARGYAIARTESGSVVRSTHEVSTGDIIVTTLADGEIISRVEGQ
jgi:exodeoxyribonuclease VII large subunit